MALEKRWCEACGTPHNGVPQSAVVWHSSCPKKQMRKPLPRYLPAKPAESPQEPPK